MPVAVPRAALHTAPAAEPRAALLTGSLSIGAACPGGPRTVKLALDGVGLRLAGCNGVGGVDAIGVVLLYG